jgi:hypothetical protein
MDLKDVSLWIGRRGMVSRESLSLMVVADVWRGEIGGVMALSRPPERDFLDVAVRSSVLMRGRFDFAGWSLGRVDCTGDVECFMAGLMALQQASSWRRLCMHVAHRCRGGSSRVMNATGLICNRRSVQNMRDLVPIAETGISARRVLSSRLYLRERENL